MGAARLRDPAPSDSRYECLLKIASGGMASVYAGRLRGAKGFRRLVAIKRAHAHLLDDHQFRRALIEEANLAARIHHPNVVSVLDVEELTEELLLVMDYVEGASLAQLLAVAARRHEPLPPSAVLKIGLDVCAGLSAAHELTDDLGEPLRLVHRDVSPQNILVGIDGLTRLADFGIAKCVQSTTNTTTGLKGKFAYMAPEYVRNKTVDDRGDLFALGVVLWEALTNDRLFRGDGDLETIQRVATLEPEPPSKKVAAVPDCLDAPILRALSKDPAARFQSATEMAAALESAVRAAGLESSAKEVGRAVRDAVGDQLEARRRVLREQLSGEESSGGSRSRVRLDLSEPTATASIAAQGKEAPTMSELPTLARAASSAVSVPPRPARSPRRGLVAAAGAVATLAALLIALSGEEKERDLPQSPAISPSMDRTAAPAETPRDLGVTVESAPVSTPSDPAAPIAPAKEHEDVNATPSTTSGESPSLVKEAKPPAAIQPASPPAAKEKKSGGESKPPRPSLGY